MDTLSAKSLQVAPPDITRLELRYIKTLGEMIVNKYENFDFLFLDIADDFNVLFENPEAPEDALKRYREEKRDCQGQSIKDLENFMDIVQKDRPKGRNLLRKPLAKVLSTRVMDDESKQLLGLLTPEGVLVENLAWYLRRLYRLRGELAAEIAAEENVIPMYREKSDSEAIFMDIDRANEGDVEENTAFSRPFEPTERSNNEQILCSGPRGIRNGGNKCYTIAALQALFTVKLWKEAISDRSTLDDDITKTLNELLAGIRCETQKSYCIRPPRFYPRLCDQRRTAAICPRCKKTHMSA